MQSLKNEINIGVYILMLIMSNTEFLWVFFMFNHWYIDYCSLFNSINMKNGMINEKQMCNPVHFEPFPALFRWETCDLRAWKF